MERAYVPWHVSVMHCVFDVAWRHSCVVSLKRELGICEDWQQRRGKAEEETRKLDTDDIVSIPAADVFNNTDVF